MNRFTFGQFDGIAFVNGAVFFGVVGVEGFSETHADGGDFVIMPLLMPMKLAMRVAWRSLTVVLSVILTTAHSDRPRSFLKPLAIAKVSLSAGWTIEAEILLRIANIQGFALTLVDRQLSRNQQLLKPELQLQTARSIVQAKLKNSRVILMRQQRRRSSELTALAIASFLDEDAVSFIDCRPLSAMGMERKS